ncbi:hypothetical protein HN836_05355, partial [Candidatus Woesearchaeota archaeon]|nr:hypothetical protein [Candidatus Woesearchaeota archaeon]
ILKIKPSININKNSLLTIPDNNKSQFDTISEGFKKINEQLKEKITNTKYTNQINKIKNIIKKQNKLLEINKKKEEEYNLVANKLYENFENNEAILNKIKDDNKIIENNTFIKKNNILKINKKNKTLIIKIQ